MEQKKRDIDVHLPQYNATGLDHKCKPSLAGRVAASTSGLLQCSLGQPPGRAVADTLASFNSQSAKGGSASSSTITCGSSSSDHVSHEEQAVSNPGESFRSEQYNGKLDEGYSFDEFLVQSKRVMPESQLRQISCSPQEKCPAPQSVGAYWADKYLLGPKTNTSTRENWNNDLAVRDGDGEAVVTLLSHPDFTAEEEPAAHWFIDTSEQKGQMLGRQPVDEWTNKHVSPSDVENRYRFVPGISPVWNLISSSFVPRGLRCDYERESFMDPKSSEIQPWVDILDKYHDEVWGDMLPLVQEARKELKTLNDSADVRQDRPAIQRLKMVLQHLHEPGQRYEALLSRH